eukprot:1361578-Amphidinium_carterae.1
MSLNKKKIDAVDVAGKRVFMRVDFNVPQARTRQRRKPIPSQSLLQTSCGTARCTRVRAQLKSS